MDGRLSQYQVELLCKKISVLARFYFIRSTCPSYHTRAAIASQVEAEMSFGPVKLVPMRTILLWEQEYRDKKYKLVPSVKGRWSRWWIIMEPDVKAKCDAYLRERTDCKGRLNLRVKDFRTWLNGEWPGHPGPFDHNDINDAGVAAFDRSPGHQEGGCYQ